MLSFSERFIQQGRQLGHQQGHQQGRQQGRQLGLQQGQAELLLHQLGLKFGEFPATIRNKVENADPGTLQRWSGRILTANTLDEVFEEDHSE